MLMTMRLLLLLMYHGIPSVSVIIPSPSIPSVSVIIPSPSAVIGRLWMWLLLTSSIPFAGAVVLHIVLILWLISTGIPSSVVKLMWLHYNSTWKVGIAWGVLHR